MTKQSTISFAAPIYPRPQQTFRAAEAANKAARPGMLKDIGGFADELFNALELASWHGSEEMPVRRKRNSLRLYALGVLSVRRFHTKHRDASPVNLWFGSDRCFYVGAAGMQRKLHPKKVKSFEQLRRLTEILPPAIITVLEKVDELAAVSERAS